MFPVIAEGLDGDVGSALEPVTLAVDPLGCQINGYVPWDNASESCRSARVGWLVGNGLPTAPRS